MRDVTRFRLVPMRARDPDESDRTASTLELFFDLVFVIAVSVAALELHHQLSEGHILNGLLSYGIVFFGIWWAWMNFTWFATSFDTDDWLYRILTIVQMSGVLVLAAGIPLAFQKQNFTVLILAYVVMRLALVAQWIRAAHAIGKENPAPLIYACGVAGVQILWLAALALPPGTFQIAIPVLIIAEITVPLIAETAGRTSWHAEHITERYGLFTLILLGESLLAAANAIIAALHTGGMIGELIEVAALSLLVTAALWWIYFWPPHQTVIGGLPSSLAYGYGHYFIFAAAGAFSAGIGVQINLLSGHSALHNPWASFTYTVPIAVFVIGVWLVAIRPNADRIVNCVVPLGALLVVADPLFPGPIIVTAVILAAIVTVLVWRQPLPQATKQKLIT